MHRDAGQHRERALGGKRHALGKAVGNGQAQGQHQDSRHCVAHRDQPLCENHERHDKNDNDHRVTVPAQQAGPNNDQAGWNQPGSLCGQEVAELVLDEQQPEKTDTHEGQRLVAVDPHLHALHLKVAGVAGHLEEKQDVEQTRRVGEDHIRDDPSRRKRTLDDKQFPDLILLQPHHHEQQRENGASELLEIKPPAHLRASHRAKADAALDHREHQHGAVTGHAKQHPFVLQDGVPDLIPILPERKHQHATGPAQERRRLPDKRATGKERHDQCRRESRHRTGHRQRRVVRHQHQPGQPPERERGKEGVIRQHVPEHEHQQHDDAENNELLQAQCAFQRTCVHGAWLYPFFWIVQPCGTAGYSGLMASMRRFSSSLNTDFCSTVAFRGTCSGSPNTTSHRVSGHGS